jgi:mono/diheme cytochrome c family protein
MKTGTLSIILTGVLVLGVGAFYLAGGFGLGGDTASATTADAAHPALVAEGKTLYAENCASCHGKNLEGQKDWRRPLPDGGLPAPPHDASGHTWHHSDRQLFDYTKKGGATVAPAGFKSNMPGFAEVMSDHQIWAVLAFIKSTWPEKIRSRQAQLNARQ